MNLFPLEMPVDSFCMGRFLKNAEGGEVYVCTKGTPTDQMKNEANFLTLYKKEQGENVPVQQPILLNQVGLPVVDGEVVSILCPQEYALAVYDAYGEQQFYFPNVLKYDPDQLQKRLASVADGEGDSLIGVKQPFLYSESRTQHDKNSEYLSILDFVGVKNDGITDCTDGINNAIYSLYNKGGGIIHFPPGKYLITGAIIIRRGVICKATPSTVYLQLGDEVNKGMVESYNFDKFRALKVSNIEEDEEFTQDYGFDGFIFDGNGDIKTNNFIGSSSVDLTSTGAKIITIAHTLWRAPLVEEIQATIRHGSFTGAGSFSPVYINSFNSSEVVFRIDVTKEASGTPVSQVVCRIN